MAPAPMLSIRSLARSPAVQDVDFTLRRGEVLGFAGLVGAGRSELMRLIFGADRPHAGTMMLDGRRFTPRRPRDAVSAGVGLAPEERRSEGLILDRSVAFNMALPSNNRFATGSLLSFRRRNRWASALSARLVIKTSSMDEKVGRLSGGNQQKVVIGR